MKLEAFIFAVTADQVGSRTADDAVPAALAALGPTPVLLPFERTAGDEIQALVDDPQAVVASVVTLTRLGGWRIGIGAGTIEQPLPPSTRAARGSAYLAARTAISAARRAPTALRLQLAGDVGGARYGELEAVARDAESALWLLRSVLSRRSPEG